MTKIRFDPTQNRSDPSQKNMKVSSRAICRFCKNRKNKHCKECGLCPGYHTSDCSEKWKTSSE